MRFKPNKRDSQEYLDFRKQVIKKDNFQCICCGAKKHLTIHHLDGWGQNPDLRFSLHNVVTLCDRIGCKAHKKFHHIYGRYNNTREQFISFLNKYWPNTKLRE